VIQRLEWDSDFWGIETGRFDLKNDFFIPDNLNDFAFVYIFSDRLLNQEELNQFNGKNHLADEKRVYHKNLNNISVLPNPNIISFYPARPIPERLYDLAIQSGHYSRFSLDPQLAKDSFKQLYRTWLERSVDRVIAEEVFVYETENMIRGFITLGIKNNKPDIGLVAVDADRRSMGIGASLLEIAEFWAYNHAKKNEIQVITQGANQGACNFYERNGYSLNAVTYIYHWWNKRS
jgi:dTDP-4-amino-4,6-dideoxy-D-galactose acyltransferase